VGARESLVGETKNYNKYLDIIQEVRLFDEDKACEWKTMYYTMKRGQGPQFRMVFTDVYSKTTILSVALYKYET
jgi:hypothetical protein